VAAHCDSDEGNAPGYDQCIGQDSTIAFLLGGALEASEEVVKVALSLWGYWCAEEVLLGPEAIRFLVYAVLIDQAWSLRI
jgi:hypothetical protein